MEGEGEREGEREPWSPGRTLGRYVALEQVGRGGMGRVLRAYDPKLQREVALKLLHTEVLDADAQDRLVREARAMARLSHPNVVTVYDVDDTASGLVLVMEFVSGQTLRDWLREAERPWPEIVARFVEAGQGLAAAHAEGLLHRDFKASNILVSHQGAVKVTDFGLAKLASGQSVDSTVTSDPESSSSRASLDGVLTAAGTVVGTPRYMAPEQHTGDPLGPAVDQYALCVALWEALTGEPCFAGQWDEVASRKRQGPPPWPDDVAVAPGVVAALRRGLAVEPKSRWPSVNALLDQLRPAERRPWGRRIAGGAVVVGLGAGGWLVWSQDQAARCSGAEAQLAGVWDLERRDAVQSAMQSVPASYATRGWEQAAEALDRYAAEWTAMYTDACEATTIRGEQSTELMDLRMACLQRAKVGLGAVTEVLADADAEVVQKAHELTGGLRAVSRCADIEALRADVEPPRPEQAERAAQIGAELAAAEVLVGAGRYARAQTILDAAERSVESLGYGPLRAEVAYLAGRNAEGRGEYEEAEAMLREALESAARWNQRELMQRSAVQLLTFIGFEQRRMVEGLHYREIAEGLAAGDPVREAAVFVAHANVLNAQGKYQEAEVEHRRAIEQYERHYGSDNEHVAAARNNLAVVLQEQGKYAEAEEQMRVSIELRQRALGPDHPHVAMSRGNLANFLSVQGKYTEAEAEHRRALALRLAALGPDHPHVAMSRGGLAGTLRSQGRLEEAEAEYRRTLEIFEDALGPEHPHVAASRNNLANCLKAQGELDQAEPLYRQALAGVMKALGPEHPNVAIIRSTLASALRDQGKYEEAQEQYRRSIEQVLTTLGPEHPALVEDRAGLARVLLEQGRPEDALAVAEPAWGRAERDDIRAELRAEAAFVLALSLAAARPAEQERARRLAQRALEFLEAAEGHRDAQQEVRRWIAGHPVGTRRSRVR